MKLLVLDNISSGINDGVIFDFIRKFLEDGDEIVIRSSDGATDLRTFLLDADSFDAIVVAGGDGSIASVSGMLAQTGIPVLPFPSGTANILALNLGLPSEPVALAKMMRQMKTMDFDLGQLTFPDGTKRDFALMAGAGYDATIMEGALTGKKMLGSMAYFTSAVTNATPQFSKIDLIIDGEEIHSSGVGVLVVNFSKIQFDISLVHENKPRDGLFDVVIMHTKDAFGLIPALFTAILDRGGDFPTRTDAFEIHQGAEIYVKADPPLPVQYDGDLTDRTTPFSAKIVPHGVRYVVSEECIKQYG